jgi:putative ABC transport system permease protein
VSALRPLFALAWRESRFARRRLLLFLSSISLGVGALVATQSFAANLAAGVRDQSRSLLGADASLSANKPFGPKTETLLRGLKQSGVPVARVTTFASMVISPVTLGTRLVQVRAVEPGFPFYGQIETAPAGRWAGLASGRNAVVDPAVLAALEIRVGDSIALGETRFRVAGTLEKVPGEVGIGNLFAPRVYIPASTVAATKLVRFGSRAQYEAFIRLPAPGAAKAILQAHRGVLRSERVQSRTADEAQQQLGDALKRLGSYLSLVGTFALLLGGIGVASAMGAYMAQKRETVATLRCLGATAPQVIVIYLTQAGVMGLAGAALGALLGAATQWVLPRLIQDMLPVHIGTALDGRALLTGVGVGVWVAVAFALLPLLQTRSVSPLEAIRRRLDAGGGAAARADGPVWLARALLAASVVLLVIFQAGDWKTGVGFTAGIGLTLLALWGTALLVTRLMRGARMARLAYPARQGLANLSRPGNQTRVVVLALGFGVFLLATLYLVQDNLLRPLRTGAGGARANMVMFDVQEDQAAGVAALVSADGARVLQRAAIVPMRIAEINGHAPAAPGAAADTGDAGPAEGRPSSDSGGAAPQGSGGPGRGGAGGGGRRSGGWAVRREYRSTFRDSLVGSEKLVQGKFWSASTPAPAPGQPAEVSLEKGIAEELSVKLGDRITWDVQGVRIPTTVTSIREVDWRRLEPNFFVVFPTQALAGAPQTWVLMAQAPAPAARAKIQSDVVGRFSNVAVIDLTQVQAALDEVLDRVAMVIRFLAAFSVATGFVVLLGAILTSRLQRIRESVLLRTLGATRRQIGAILLAEYLALGIAASLAGIGLSAVGGWALCKWVFELDFGLPVLPLLGLAAAVSVLSALVGLWASREVFRHTPLEMLREE